jgi:hypothetical protein
MRGVGARAMLSIDQELALCAGCQLVAVLFWRS